MDVANQAIMHELVHHIQHLAKTMEKLIKVQPFLDVLDSHASDVALLAYLKVAQSLG